MRLLSPKFSPTTRKLLDNFFSLLVLRGFEFIVPLLTLPLLVRTLGLEPFGKISFALAFSAFFGSVIKYGFAVTATRDVARQRENKIVVNTIYCEVMSSAIFLALVSFFAFMLIVFMFDAFRSELLLYVFCFLVVLFQSLFPVWLFQGMESMRKVAYLNFIARCLYLLSLFLFIEEPSDYIFVPLINALSLLLALVLSIVIAMNEFGLRFKFVGFSHIKQVLTDGWNVFVSQLSPFAYTNAAPLLLGAFAGPSSVGVFSACVKVSDALGSLAYVISSAFYPLVSRDISWHRNFVRIMGGAALLLMLALSLCAEEIVRLLYGAQKLELASYLAALSLVFPFLFMQIALGQNFLPLVGRDRALRNILIMNSVVSVLYTFPLVALCGIWGAIASLVIARMIISLQIFIQYRRALAEGFQSDA